MSEQNVKDNSENMAIVREAMAMRDQVQQGGDLTEGVPINYESSTGKKYVGTVVFKKPTMKDYMRMGSLKSEFLRQGGAKDLNLVDDSIKFMAHVMSMLMVVVTKSPEWLLDIPNIEEPDILYHVFYEWEDWENSFRKKVPEASAADSGTSEGEKGMGTP